jgi:hypothetical protein
MKLIDNNDKQRKSPHRLTAILACCLMGISFLPACDPIGVDETYSYTSFSVKVIYSDTTYTFTYNGDTLLFYNQSLSQPLTIGRKDLEGTLRACRGESLELDTFLRLTPKETLSFIQLPGEKIKSYDPAEEDADEPTDRSCTKMRFFYKTNNVSVTADSVRFIWISSTKANLNLPGGTTQNFDTTVVHKGKLSDYVEFDNDKYADLGSGNTYFHYTHQTWNGSAWTGSTKKTMRTYADYKLATCEYSAALSFGIIFGVKWE